MRGVTYFCTSSLPITRINVASVRFATALAQSVFPVPGGPYNITPFGGSIPRFTNRSGYRVSFHLPTGFYGKQWSLDNLSQSLNLLLAPTNVGIRNIGFFLYLHHGNGWIDLRREGELNGILLTIHTHSHSLLNICRRHSLTKTNN